MRASIRIVLWLAGGLIAAAHPAPAQWDPGNGPASLKINGVLPSVADPTAHRVFVGNSTSWNLAIRSIGPAPFVLVAQTALTPGAIITPWWGSVDMVNPVVVLNGIFPATPLDALAVTDFEMTLPLVYPGSVGPAVQAVVLDFTAFPLPYRNTEAGQAYGLTNVSVGFPALGDDDFVAYQPVYPIVFSGVAYSTVYISSNGMATFGGPAVSYSPSAPGFFDGFNGGGVRNPGVAVMWGDFNPPSATGDSVHVFESLTAGFVQISWLAQTHYASGTAAGSWTIEFADDGFTLNHFGYLPGTVADGQRIVGVTDGLVTPTFNNDNDITATGGFGALPSLPWTPAGAGEQSICEVLPPAGAPTFKLLTVVHFCQYFPVTPGDYMWLVTDIVL